MIVWISFLTAVLIFLALDLGVFNKTPHIISSKEAGKWTKVVVYYDMGQVVNAISSKKANANLEVSDTDDDAAILKDCYVAILSQNKGGVVEISDVTLKKK